MAREREKMELKKSESQPCKSHHKTQNETITMEAAFFFSRDENEEDSSVFRFCYCSWRADWARIWRENVSIIVVA